MRTGVATVAASVVATVLGLLTYEVVALTVALLALVVGSLGLWLAYRLSRRMDAWLDSQAERTEVLRSEFRDHLDGG